MARKLILGIAGVLLLAGSAAPSASATSSPIRLLLNENDAFAILGHWCGGIQQSSYATGFALDGYPTGVVYMQTKCGGSGRGGGYKTTTYSGWAEVVWTWFGETRSYTKTAGAGAHSEGFSASDEHGDRIYDEGNYAWLQTGEEPPYQAPSAPSNVSAGVAVYESGEAEYLRMNVTWTLAPETAGLISSSTVIAEPVGSSAPVLSTTVGGGSEAAAFFPVEPNTTYRVTVTNSDAEGTSPASETSVKTPNEDGEAEKQAPPGETCEKNSGTITLSPGLTEKPHVQTMTVRGTIEGCDGPLSMSSGSYVEHLKSTEELTCTALSSSSIEPTTKVTSLSLNWAPSEAGHSAGSLLYPISEASLTPLTGTLTGGEFEAGATVSAESLSESFTGGAECGVPHGKHKAKPVKKGTFATAPLSFG